MYAHNRIRISLLFVLCGLESLFYLIVSVRISVDFMAIFKFYLSGSSSFLMKRGCASNTDIERCRTLDTYGFLF